MKMVELDSDALGVFGRKNERGTPERNLLMAILERAILDYVGNDQKEVAAAKDWIFEKGGDYPPNEFSLDWICLQLDLDSKKVRDTIDKMPRRGSRRVAPWYFANAG